MKIKGRCSDRSIVLFSSCAANPFAFNWWPPLMAVRTTELNRDWSHNYYYFYQKLKVKEDQSELIWGFNLYRSHDHKVLLIYFVKQIVQLLCRDLTQSSSASSRLISWWWSYVHISPGRYFWSNLNHHLIIANVDDLCIRLWASFCVPSPRLQIHNNNNNLYWWQSVSKCVAVQFERFYFARPNCEWVVYYSAKIANLFVH